MPRGDNPKSKENLSKGRRFNSESGRKAQIKSAESHRMNSRFREAGREALTDEALNSMFEAIIRKAESGNVSAFKTLFDIMGEAKKNPEDSQENNIVFIAEMRQPELPPPDIFEDE